jgi:hypothetical protein
MGIQDWVEEIRQDYARYGLRGFKFNIQDLFQGILSRGGFWINYGDDYYSRKWDLLVVLDACRWDLFEEVADEYDFIESSGTFMSNASHSREWLHKHFMEPKSTKHKIKAWIDLLPNVDNMAVFEDHYTMSGRLEVAETAYITWNVFARMLEGDAFYEYVPVGKAKWDDSDIILNPRTITDETIRVMRESEPEYVIAHYMQPHTPFRDSGGSALDGSAWERIQRGEKQYDEAWTEYKNNLRWVLDDVKLLLENVDAEKVVITADHGNAIGEWSCYGHRPYVPNPAMKRVPWALATATDKQTYEPEPREEYESASEEEITERLEALGYK